MATSAFTNYRAIGRPIEFAGLKGPYILVAAAALMVDLLLFVILYCCGTPPWLCVAIAFGLGGTAIGTARGISRRFGADGLRKHLAARRLPHGVRFESRQVFLNLLKNPS